MYCTKCGNENTGDYEYCLFCGSPLGGGGAASGMGMPNAESAMQNGYDRRASMNAGGYYAGPQRGYYGAGAPVTRRQTTVKAVMILFSVILLILFFVPFTSIAGGLQEYSFSLAAMTFGTKIMGTQFPAFEMDGMFYLFVPIILILIWSVRTKYHVAFTSLILSALYAILLLTHQGVLRSNWNTSSAMLGYSFSDYGVRVSETFWFVLAVILAILMAILSFMLLTGRAKESDTDFGRIAGDFTGTVADAVSNIGSGYGRVCQKCGTKIARNSGFCTNCGARYQPPVDILCPTCGRQVKSTSAFCPGCGSSIGAGS